jgi:hypothetical protein
MSEKPLRYCGREFTQSEIALIRQMIVDYPTANRAQLSRMVSEALDWRRIDGRTKEMSCRVAMLRMQDDGLLSLPPPRFAFANRRTNHYRTSQADPGLPLLARSPKALQPLHLQQVNPGRESHLWNEFIDRYHYLGYQPLPGAQLRFFVRTAETIVALLGFGAAAWKTAPRDSFIGWTPEQRLQNLHLVINNARFLILPWIQCKNLASYILGLVVRQLPEDWYQRYGYRPVLLETFVESPRFKGTCYKAANWLYLGTTQGRGKLDVHHEALLPKKAVWALPLDRHFRQILTTSHLPT